MSLSKRLKPEFDSIKSPRDTAQKILDLIELDDLCDNIEVAGPGFINLKLNDGWIQQS